MTTPGTGWVRRVTTETLTEFRALLRTGIERAAEALSGGDALGEGAPEGSTTSPGSDVTATEITGPSGLFDGTPFQVPSRYRSHPGRSTAPSTPRRAPVPAAGSTTADTSPEAVRRWFKKLSPADAQQPRGAKTNPTGHLTLVQSGHPIQPATWFRDDLFADADWVPETSPGGPRERATLSFRVRLAGDDLGAIPLQVAHTPRFASHQGNRTTTVHWGPPLAPG